MRVLGGICLYYWRATASVLSPEAAQSSLSHPGPGSSQFSPQFLLTGSFLILFVGEGLGGQGERSGVQTCACAKRASTCSSSCHPLPRLLVPSSNFQSELKLLPPPVVLSLIIPVGCWLRNLQPRVGATG